MVCACVSIILEVSTATEEKRSIAWIDGFAIFLAVCFCSTVQASNDYQKEKQFQKLNKVADDKKMVKLLLFFLFTLNFFISLKNVNFI